MPRIKIGDVVEIPTKSGLAYAQYTHSTKSDGSVLRVMEGLFSARPSDLNEALASGMRFTFLFPLSIAVHRKIFEVVGNLPVPEAWLEYGGGPDYRSSFFTFSASSGGKQRSETAEVNRSLKTASRAALVEKGLEAEFLLVALGTDDGYHVVLHSLDNRTPSRLEKSLTRYKFPVDVQREKDILEFCARHGIYIEVNPAIIGHEVEIYRYRQELPPLILFANPRLTDEEMAVETDGTIILRK